MPPAGGRGGKKGVRPQIRAKADDEELFSPSRDIAARAVSTPVTFPTLLNLIAPNWQQRDVNPHSLASRLASISTAASSNLVAALSSSPTNSSSPQQAPERNLKRKADELSYLEYAERARRVRDHFLYSGYHLVAASTSSSIVIERYSDRYRRKIGARRMRDEMTNPSPLLFPPEIYSTLVIAAKSTKQLNSSFRAASAAPGFLSSREMEEQMSQLVQRSVQIKMEQEEQRKQAIYMIAVNQSNSSSARLARVNEEEEEEGGDDDYMPAISPTIANVNEVSSVAFTERNGKVKTEEEAEQEEEERESGDERDAVVEEEDDIGGGDYGDRYQEDDDGEGGDVFGDDDEAAF